MKNFIEFAKFMLFIVSILVAGACISYILLMGANAAMKHGSSSAFDLGIGLVILAVGVFFGAMILVGHLIKIKE